MNPSFEGWISKLIFYIESNEPSGKILGVQKFDQFMLLTVYGKPQAIGITFKWFRI